MCVTRFVVRAFEVYLLLLSVMLSLLFFVSFVNVVVNRTVKFIIFIFVGFITH